MMLFCLFVTLSTGAVWWYAYSTGLPTPTPLATIPPEAAITSELLNGNSASFAFHAKDSGNTTTAFECQLDNLGFSDCASPKEYHRCVPAMFGWTITVTTLTVQAQTQISQAQKTQTAQVQQSSTAQIHETQTAQAQQTPTVTSTPTNTPTGTPTGTPTPTFPPTGTGAANASGTSITN